MRQPVGSSLAAGREPGDITEPSDGVHVLDGQKVLMVNGVAYQKLGVVGRGGSSKVFKVLSPSGRTLALKRVMTCVSKQFRMFRNEIQLLQDLRGKPNIIQIVDSEVSGREKLLVLMEFGRIQVILISYPQFFLFMGISRYWESGGC